MSTADGEQPGAMLPTRAARRWPWRMCAVIAALLLIVGNLGIWSYRTVTDTARFVDLTQQVFLREDVREALATRIVDRVLPDSPLLRRRLGNTLVPIVAGLLKSETYQVILANVTTQVHLALTEGRPIGVNILAPELREIILAVGRVLAPEQAASLRPEAGAATIELFSSVELPSYEREIQYLRWAGIIGGSIGLVLLILPIVVRRDRWSLGIAGLALVGMALGTFVIIWLSGVLIDRQISNPQVQTLVSAISDRLNDELFGQTLVALMVGAILTVVGLVPLHGLKARSS